MTAKTSPAAVDPATQREIAWRKKLRRLRFNAEPLEEQVAKYRRATIVLTIVPSIVALMIVAIFTAFRRPDIGLIAVAILFIPVLTWAWLDFLLLKKRVDAYLAEKRSATST